MPKPISLPARTATADEAYDEEDDYEGENEPNMKFIHALFVVLVLHVIAVGGIFAFNSMKAKQAKTAAKPPAATETAKPDAAASTAVAATAPATAKPANPSLEGWKGRTHTVVAGDTLARIAAANKISADVIGKENNITTYSTLHVGQILKIPTTDKTPAKTAAADSAKHPSDTAAKQAFLSTKADSGTKPAVAAVADTPAAKTTTESKTPAADGEIYVVAKGENPYSIAKKLHVGYNDLLAANGIKDPTKIQIGQKLKIPEKKN